jgi:superfamily I DNA/RNA helicase
MYREGMGYRVGMTAGSWRVPRAARLVNGLVGRMTMETADRAWLLRVCQTREEAAFYELLFSIRYSIPTAVFIAKNRLTSMSQATLDRLYASIDTRANAARLMADLGLDYDYPHHRAHGVTSRGTARRVQVHLTMFGANRGSHVSPWHLQLGEAEPEPDQQAVALLTVHGAKGREWPVVFVVGVEEGLLPHARPGRPGEPAPDDAEERRLTYVALSRCQVQLYLTYCRARRPTRDGEMARPEPRRPSRYLRALPAELVEPAV